MSCKNDTKGTKLENSISININPGLISGRLNKFNLMEGAKLVFDKLKQDPDFFKSKKDIPLPQSTNANFDKAFAVGKKLLMIDRESYGPSLEQRKDGIDMPVDSLNNIDTFRLVSAKYWASDANKRSITYLLGEGSKHSVSSYGNAGPSIALTDNKAMELNFNFNINEMSIRQRQSQFAINAFSSIDKILNVYTRQTPKEEGITIFSTMQKVTIVAKKGLFTDISFPQPSSPGNGANDISLPAQQLKYAVFQDEKKTFTYNPQKWRSYVEGGALGSPPLIETGKDYFDYVFDMPIPFSKKEISHNSFISNPLVYECDFNYNFYIKEYEEKIKNASEKLLPNFYVFEMEMTSDTANEEYQKMITLAGSLDVKEAIIILPTNNIVNFAEINSNYFGKFADAYDRIARTEPTNSVEVKKKEDLMQIDTMGSNIGIPVDNVSILNKFYNYRVMFPMIVDLQFSTDKTTVIANILKDCKLDKEFIKDIITGDIGKAEEKRFIESAEVLTQEKNNLGSVTSTKSSISNNVKRRMWDMSKWLLDVNEEKSKLKDGLIFFKDDDTGKELESEVVKNLFRIVFVGKLKKFLKSKFRSYEEMINGQPAYSETVMYRIEKSLADAQGNKVGEPIQNYYISNGNDIDVMKLVDTQIKYNVRYRYDVFAYQLVIGTKYRYVDKQVMDDSAAFSVIQTPSVVLVEVPYFNYSDIMLDAPPVRPEVDLIPYKGIDNKLLLFFQGNIGSYYEMPIAIDERDKIRISDYKRAKKIAIDEPILFESDDHSSTFQVFRTDVKPKEYSDFAGRLLVEVQTDISPLTAQSATSAAFVDSIKPNRKYWYCFRSVDNHDHLSQPSEVFQMEMINDHGTVYPSIRVFDMDKEREEKSMEKPVRRYLYVTPTLLQKLVNDEKSGISELDSAKDIDPKKLVLGVSDATVWGNTYKIRLTSRKTGRKVDINVSCDSKGVRKEKNIL